MPSPTPELTRLTDQLQRAFDGEAWSGPSLLTTLAGLTAAQAAARPLPGAHSVWKIVQHVATWARVVQRRLADNQAYRVSEAEDWPPVPTPADEAQWQHTLAELRAAHDALLSAASALPEAALDHVIGSSAPDRAQALGVSVYVSLHGVAQHYLYHAGQVALLRKLL